MKKRRSAFSKKIVCHFGNPKKVQKISAEMKEKVQKRVLDFFEKIEPD